MTTIKRQAAINPFPAVEVSRVWFHHDGLKITMWVSADIVDDGYDQILYKTVTDWIEADWPFKKPAYPGRSVSWEDWESLEKAVKAN